MKGLKDFDEDHREKMKTLTLLERVKAPDLEIDSVAPYTSSIKSEPKSSFSRGHISFVRSHIQNVLVTDGLDQDGPYLLHVEERK